MFNLNTYIYADFFGLFSTAIGIILIISLLFLMFQDIVGNYKKMLNMIYVGVAVIFAVPSIAGVFLQPTQEENNMLSSIKIAMLSNLNPTGQALFLESDLVKNTYDAPLKPLIGFLKCSKPETKAECFVFVEDLVKHYNDNNIIQPALTSELTEFLKRE